MLGKYKITNEVDKDKTAGDSNRENNKKSISITSTVPAKDKSLYMQLLTLSHCSYFDRDVNDLLHATGYSNWTQVKKGYGTSGFEYLICKNQHTDEYAILFTGSDEPLDYLIDVVEVGLDIVKSQRKQAEAVIKDFAKDPETKNAKFYIAGHSLGGYLAQWTAGNISLNKLEGVKSSNFIKCYTFNAPGVNTTELEIFTEILKGDMSKITNFVIDTDLVKEAHYYCHVGKVVTFPIDKRFAHSIKYFYAYNYN
ncbi:Lipase (class 3) [Anaerovirgula multivorans]|uniref:Lipase (Class 3) n=1 Tax=Anaerovirgula multivorans TaxID=312168 RepID=A0A239F0I2_9FIRM|nr:DUF2974 domain-containing protein [Anaerovirgula multivorans]SNS50399.1 Lipase (class 3) [Anaerovirgula multivorans]